jgi:hypothetical protein
MMRSYILLLCLVMAVLMAPAQQLFPPAVGPAVGPGYSGGVQGSPLLFSDWVSAKVESRSPFFANDSLLFNYDKQRQVLLATLDKHVAYKIDRKEFQRVTFFLNGQPYTFEHVPAINDKDLFQVVVEDSGRYCLYKFSNTAIRGRRYVDWLTYYIVFPFPDMRVVKLEKWDKKLLKRSFALSADAGKVDAFYLQYVDLAPGEEFLRGLVNYLDQ